MYSITSTPVKSAAGTFLYCTLTGNFLWCRRAGRTESSTRGMWACLGGGVDPGENIHQALLRELWEEAKINLQPYNPIPFYSSSTPKLQFTNFITEVPYEIEPTLNDEHDMYVWASKPPAPIHPGVRIAYNKLLEVYPQYRSREYVMEPI